MLTFYYAMASGNYIIVSYIIITHCIQIKQDETIIVYRLLCKFYYHTQPYAITSAVDVVLI